MKWNSIILSFHSSIKSFRESQLKKKISKYMLKNAIEYYKMVETLIFKEFISVFASVNNKQTNKH